MIITDEKRNVKRTAANLSAKFIKVKVLLRPKKQFFFFVGFQSYVN